jgi:CRISPR/Cas system-associated exonuclease Cas4 (RecB family)
MPGRRLPTIRASEIGEYVYCARAWWLRRVAGLEPEGRERREYGATRHHRHARSVALSRLLAIIAALMGALALALLAGGGLAG